MLLVLTIDEGMFALPRNDPPDPLVTLREVLSEAPRYTEKNVVPGSLEYIGESLGHLDWIAFG